MPTDLRTRLAAAAAEHGFSGAVQVVGAGDRVESVEFAAGAADRRFGVPNSVDTRFAIASGTKGLTAVTVMSLVADGALRLDESVRTLLGSELPLIDDRVTVEHLLAHRSGIGDYLDEDAGGSVEDYVMPVPVHLLDETAGYLDVLDGHAQVFDPGTRFAYNNSGYVVLAALVERAAGTTFRDAVTRRVLAPAGMSRTEFLRSDDLPADAATGHLVDGRTNVLHLPVRGSGDGGVYTTLADVRRFWTALFSGALLPIDVVEAMTSVVSTETGESQSYGLGFWLDDPWVALEGYDAGVSFRTLHDPRRDLTATVIANTSGGAWPIARLLADALA